MHAAPEIFEYRSAAYLRPPRPRATTQNPPRLPSTNQATNLEHGPRQSPPPIQGLAQKRTNLNFKLSDRYSPFCGLASGRLGTHRSETVPTAASGGLTRDVNQLSSPVHVHGLDVRLLARRADSLLRHQEQRLACEARRPKARDRNKDMRLVRSRAVSFLGEHTIVALVLRTGAAAAGTDLPVPDPLLLAVFLGHELEGRNEGEWAETAAIEARQGRLRGAAAELGVDTLAGGTILRGKHGVGEGSIMSGRWWSLVESRSSCVSG